MASNGGVVEGKVLVGIFAPAFSYPASLSYAATVKAALADLGLHEEECEFMKQDNNRLACIIKNNKFTLQYVEETYAHNKALIDQLQRAADALVAFRTKVEEDAILISQLKEQINTNKSGWELKYEEEHNLRNILQDKLEKLKTVVNSVADHTEPNRPKVPKLQLTSMNGAHSEPLLSLPRKEREREAERGSPRDFSSSSSPSAPRYLSPSASSPRENTINSFNTSPGQTTNMNMNGKRSISTSSLMSTTSTTTSPNLSSPSSVSSPRDSSSHTPSPRSTTISPRSPSPRASPRTGHASPRTAVAFATANVHREREREREREKEGRESREGIRERDGRESREDERREGERRERETHLRRHSTNFGEIHGHVRRLSNSTVEFSLPPRTSTRSKSSSEIPPHYFDLTQPIDVHSLMPVVHTFSYAPSSSSSSPSSSSSSSPLSSDSVSSALKRRSVASPIQHHRQGSQTQFDYPAAENLNQCRLCGCEKFRAGKAEWMCSSPAPSPTVSPRKIG